MDNTNATKFEKKIDIFSTTPIRCSHCGNDVFVEALKFRKASRLLTGDPQDTIIPISILVCGECGEICEQLLTNDIKLLFSKDKEREIKQRAASKTTERTPDSILNEEKNQ